MEKWSGPFLARAIQSLRKPPPPMATEENTGPIRIDGDVIVEASPLPSFDTAAGHFPKSKTVDLPSDVRAAYRGETVYLRAVDRRSGKVVGCYRRRAHD